MQRQTKDTFVHVRTHKKYCPVSEKITQRYTLSI